MTDSTELREQLEKVAKSFGAKAFGVADLDMLKQKEPGLLDNVPGDYPRAVVMGLRLQQTVLDDIIDKPTPLYFHHYRQLNYALDRVGLALADLLQDAGQRALAIPASQTISRNPMLGCISHKLLGWAAGIGFIGRSTLLVHPQFGAQLRYVSILTDAPLTANTPYDGPGCAACRACADSCPASAIHEDRTDFDLATCHAKLTEFSRIPFVAQHICGVCVKVCQGRRP